MFLKTAEFTYNGHSLVLNELSALQRLSFLEFIATAEADAQKDEGDSETRRSAKMIGLAIRAGALLVAQSLWHNDPAGKTETELQTEVLSTWPAEAIAKAEHQVKKLSGMLPSETPTAADDPSSDNESSREEDATAAKP
ncbi:TPA: phage minor tail protein G [Kluyvera intermedia]|uniref:Tail assembly protein G domain-containing protein n=2 Tax=Enterobacteriaceae TaxID=543 RepID=A0AAC8QMA6_9ENTR|nr:MULTISPECIES: phage minor tail protein G [Phytobacter]HAT2203342.1 phage minor tail protein G [Kluyvera intermedia]AKL11401.1 hypothetical protein AB182_08820 [Phytobacter ursingii]MDC0728553.1 phage minor tail protein G [Phytobacter diazotrophicus]MDC0735750.1 phage minor tail protein G [Phytobacter diazotrophicus]MDV2875759.1 phage minor tail protein G [Phytobacter diazotrophicus]